jgi:hypothetical protein
MFPHFLCIGAQKAGTTWLHHNLALQSGIWCPPVKEMHFFDHAGPSWLKRVTGRQSHLRLARAYAHDTLVDFVRGKSAFIATKQALRLGYGARDWNWYEAIFPNDANLICGEVCPGYACLPEDVIERIVERNAAIKVIYLLRDPVDRAWSSIAMHFRKKPGSDVSDVGADELVAFLMRRKSLAHCQYAENIARWREHVPAQQLYFGFFERIAAEPGAYLTEVLRFLGYTATPNLDAAVEPVNAGRGERIERAIEQRIARALAPQADAMHRMFANAYTERWLEHARAAAG